MGQQASSEDLPEQAPWWCGSSSAADAPAPSASSDTVAIAGCAPREPGDDAEELAYSGVAAGAQPAVRIPRQPQGGCLCGFGAQQAPYTEVVDVLPRSATVKWSTGQLRGVRRFHVDVLLVAPEDAAGPSAREVAFFEVGSEESCIELPPGTLDRASGPYRVQVWAETGTAERPLLSHPGSSAPFLTLPEPPGPVGARLAGEPSEESVGVQWDEPFDDGGSTIESYEVVLFKASSQTSTYLDEGAEPANADPLAQLTTRERSHVFDCLRPGSGPFEVEVRARSSAGLLGPASRVRASTAVAAPAQPVQLRARLMPSWSGRASADSEGAAAEDVDVVRLEFVAPVADGGRPLDSYLIYAAEEIDPIDLPLPSEGDVAGKDHPAQKGKRGPLTTMPALAASCPGELVAGCQCSCDVGVEPNRAYTFTVEAFNGVRHSGQSEPAPTVFVPARVPAPPKEPPEVFRAEGGLAAELRWAAPQRAGGLPLHSFKVGVVGPFEGDQIDAGGLEVQREVTVSCSGALALAAGGAWQPSKQLGSGEALYGARIGGLQADAKYRFLLAAANRAGTGRWSGPSALVKMPVGAPAAPVNAVATVTLDSEQAVVVSVTWECGASVAGSGTLAGFNVRLVPQKLHASGTSSSSSGVSISERIPVPGAAAGRKVSWSKPLTRPGQYMVEIVAENSTGQQSLPASLALEVRPEAFPPELQEVPPDMPHWAEEPVLVLGPAVPGEPRFANFDEAHSWLQVLLLWHGGDPGAPEPAPAQGSSKGSTAPPATIDVVCQYRCPGTGEAKMVVLSAGVVASRLQAALPSHVPISLRLVACPKALSEAKATKGARVQSDPLLLLMSENGDHLSPVWEVWARQSRDGGAPRWTPLPEELQVRAEAAWLEGQCPKWTFELPERRDTSEDEEGCALPAGQYELTFGDERRVQHSVKRVGAGGFLAKARRMVRDGGGEEAAAPMVAGEDQCIVCMERRRTHAFMHAETGDGHLAVCGSCAELFRAESAAGGANRTMKTCPMCRRGFTAIQRIYQ